MNKQDLVQRIIRVLGDELQVIEASKSMANEEVLPSDDLAESQREPRAVETSYFVDGQTKRAREVKEAILAYETTPLRAFQPGEPVALFSLVQLEGAGEAHTYFIGPKAGGLEVSFEGGHALVLTPQSPLGRRLIGRNLGDSIVVEEGPRGRSLSITRIT